MNGPQLIGLDNMGTKIYDIRYTISMGISAG